MPPRNKEKGKVPHTYEVWGIVDILCNLGAPLHVRVLRKAMRCHRSERTNIWSNNSNTEMKRRQLFSYSFKSSIHGKNHGAIHPACAHWACEGQPRDQDQPAWVHERQVLLDQPDLLL